MITVWKYQLPILDEFTLMMPRGAAPLHVDVQGGVPCLWALVDTEEEHISRQFRIAGTGHPLADAPPQWWIQMYVGSFQFGPALVFHLFQMMSDGQ